MAFALLAFDGATCDRTGGTALVTEVDVCFRTVNQLAVLPVVTAVETAASALGVTTVVAGAETAPIIVDRTTEVGAGPILDRRGLVVGNRCLRHFIYGVSGVSSRKAGGCHGRSHKGCYENTHAILLSGPLCTQNYCSQTRCKLVGLIAPLETEFDRRMRRSKSQNVNCLGQRRD